MHRDCVISFVRNLLAAATILIAASPPDTADTDDAGPVIALPPADRTELDGLLGKGVVGEAVPSKPIAAPELHLPRESVALTYRLLDEKGKATTEQHTLSDADPSQSAGGW